MTDELAGHLEVFADAATTPGIQALRAAGCDCPFPGEPGYVKQDCPVHDPAGTFHAEFDRYERAMNEAMGRARCPDCDGTGVWATSQMVERCPTCKGRTDKETR